MRSRVYRRVAMRPVRNLARNWDGALVLFTAFVSFFGPAWAVSELGMSAGWATIVVAVVFVTATGAACIAMYIVGRRRARADRRRAQRRAEALRVLLETLAGG